LTPIQIIAKILGLKKSVPIPNIVVTNNITLHNSNTISFDIENLYSGLDYQVDLDKISITSESSFHYTKIFDDIGHKIILTISINDEETSGTFRVIFNKGTVTQTGDINQGYKNNTTESEVKICEIHMN
jgi:hypothetical protein